MRGVFSIFATIALLTCSPALVACSKHHYGVDDWTAEDFGRHFREDAGVDLPTSAILAAGIDGSSFFAVSDVDLAPLRLQPAQQDAVRRSLDKLFDRVNTKPVDFWEWRAANRRLSDNWIVPLAISPRALLIWARFFDRSDSFDHIKGSIYEPSLPVFWLQWLFVPHYPLHQIARQAFDSHTYYDDIVQFVYAFGVVVDIVVAALSVFDLRKVYALLLATMRIGLESASVQFLGQLAILALTTLWALFSYYVLWRALPLPINTMLFDVHVSVAIPVMILGSFYISHLIADRYVKLAKPPQKTW